jgi:putative transposase
MTNYPTNLSNSQWQIIANFLDVERNRKYSLLEIVNGIFYLVKSECQCRMLPKDFPNWKLVYYYFSTWTKAGIIEHIHEPLVKNTKAPW